MEEKVKKLHNQVNTLRVCNLIMTVFYSLSMIILWVRYHQICMYYHQVVDTNMQILSELQRYLELLEQFLETVL